MNKTAGLWGIIIAALVVGGGLRIESLLKHQSRQQLQDALYFNRVNILADLRQTQTLLEDDYWNARVSLQQQNGLTIDQSVLYRIQVNGCHFDALMVSWEALGGDATEAQTFKLGMKHLLYAVVYDHKILPEPDANIALNAVMDKFTAWLQHQTTALSSVVAAP